MALSFSEDICFVAKDSKGVELALGTDEYDRRDHVGSVVSQSRDVPGNQLGV